MTIAVLAGGIATRLYPVTKTIPKAMLELAGKPFIDHQLELFKGNKIKRVVICAGYLGDQLQAYVGDGRRFGVDVHFSFDGEKLLGTAGAIKKALPLLGESFAVIYGDSYLPIDLKPIEEAFFNSGKKGLMTVFKNNDNWDTSNVVCKDGQIVTYDKKNKSKDMNYIDYGLSFFKKEVFDRLPGSQVLDLADVCTQLAAAGELARYEVKERFYEIGSFKGLEETKKYLVNKEKR